MTFLGKQHSTLVEWLVNDWWSSSAPVAVIQGFPGVGKTEIAIQAMTMLDQKVPSLLNILVHCPESILGIIDDLLLNIAEALAFVGDQEIMRRVEQGDNSSSIIRGIMTSPRLIIIDESQLA